MSKAIVSTKGHLIDIHCKHKGGVIVASDDLKSVYDCTLNQTNITNNNNKFYIMQVIQLGPKFCVYIRYGRIGETGVINYKDYSNKSSAITFFTNQFRAKTGNNWNDRENFEKKNGKYFMTEIECAEISAELSDSEESEPEIDLDPRVVNFLTMITDTTYMKNTLMQLEIDTEKMPLGKISQTQIDKAYEILNRINKSLEDHDHSELANLSSEFYTLIPYACGRQAPPVINSKKLIGKNVNLLNELSQMVFGTCIVTKFKNNNNNLLKTYNSLNTTIVPLDKSDEMYKILALYLKNSKAPTHDFDYKIMEIFEIDRIGEKDLYDAFSKKISNKTLLFHGTRVSNMVGILTTGLLCDPSKLGINVSITGKMFGLGLYWSDSASKSIQYCAYDSSDNIACLFIGEIALGKMYKKKQAACTLTAKTLPKPYNSTWGIGRSSYKEYDEYDDGTRIPSGKLQKISANSDSSLLYDEFIVYHEEQINLRYIIKLKVLD